jgi:hypothetical protein
MKTKTFCQKLTQICAIIVAVCGVLSCLAAGAVAIHRIMSSYDKIGVLDQKINHVETKIDSLESGITRIEDNLKKHINTNPTYAIK